MSESANVLEVRDLTTRFFTQRGVIGAVESISFDVGRGEAVGIVGESGSGKSVTALSLLRLVPMPGRIVAGSITLNGRDVSRLSDERDARGPAQRSGHDLSGRIELPQSDHSRSATRSRKASRIAFRPSGSAVRR